MTSPTGSGRAKKLNILDQNEGKNVPFSCSPFLHHYGMFMFRIPLPILELLVCFLSQDRIWPMFCDNKFFNSSNSSASFFRTIDSWNGSSYSFLPAPLLVSCSSSKFALCFLSAIRHDKSPLQPLKRWQMCWQGTPSHRQFPLGRHLVKKFSGYNFPTLLN